MRDEEYRPEQIPEYGLRAQPHLAEVSRHTLTTVLIGTAIALLSVIAAVLAVASYPSLIGDVGRVPVRYALWCALLMLLITGYQAVSWRVAFLEWSGKRDFTLNAFALVSYIIHFISYAVVIAGMWFMLSAMVIAGVLTMAFWMSAIAVIGLVAAQIIGATEYLRRGGPSGTLPAHMRELIHFNRVRNQPGRTGRPSHLDLD